MSILGEIVAVGGMATRVNQRALGFRPILFSGSEFCTLFNRRIQGESTGESGEENVKNRQKPFNFDTLKMINCVCVSERKRAGQAKKQACSNIPYQTQVVYLLDIMDGQLVLNLSFQQVG